MAGVVFMGSPAFAVPSLRALARDGHGVVAVVTQPDRSAGRGGHLREPPVKAAARELNIPTLQPESFRDGEAVARLAAARPEMIVVAAYGKILPRSVLSIPRWGSLNVHASLLPRWRGASPIAAAIRAGDRETGVSIMEMVARMDAGPVVGQTRLAIEDGMTTGTLEPLLAAKGAELLLEVLPAWRSGELVAQPQDEEAATYCRTLAKKDAQLGADLTAIEAERAVRAFDPWPGAYIEYSGGRLAIWKAHVHEGSAPAGTTRIVDRRPAIAFREGLLILDEVQLPGRRRVTGASFLNGQRDWLQRTAALA